jgi:glycosyltransferase involved in cell wall biosynthesis
MTFYKPSDITICIPTYDRTFGLSEAIESALAQGPTVPILVVDNASPHDKIRKIVDSYATDRIKFIQNDRNVGVFANWNKCAHLAKTEFMAILGSDDILAPKFVSDSIKALNQNPDLSCVYGRYHAFHDNIEDGYDKGSIPIGLNDGIALCETAALSGLCFPVCFTMRSKLLRDNPYRELPHGMNDWLWVYSVLTKEKIFGYDTPLAFWRTHGDQDSISSGVKIYITYPEIMSKVVAQLGAGHPLRKKAIQTLKETTMNLFLLVNEGVWRKPEFLDFSQLPSHPSTLAALPYIKDSIHLRMMCRLNGLPWKLYSIIPRIFRRLGLPYA